MDVSTLGGGGDGDSTLDPRVASLEASLPEKASQVDLTGLSGIVALEADQSALSAVAASAVQSTGSSIVNPMTSTLRGLQTQLPLMLVTTDTTATVILRPPSQPATDVTMNKVQLSSSNDKLTLSVSDVATFEDGDAQVMLDRTHVDLKPHQLRMKHTRIDSRSGAIRFEVTPDLAAYPTHLNTRMTIMPDGRVGIGIEPQGSARLHVLGDVCIDGGLSANQPALTPWCSVTAQSNVAFTAQEAYQQCITIITRTAPIQRQPLGRRNPGRRQCVTTLALESRSGKRCALSFRRFRERSASLRKRTHSTVRERWPSD